MQQAVTRISTLALDNFLRNSNKFYYKLQNRHSTNILSHLYIHHTQHSTMPKNIDQNYSPTQGDSSNLIFVQRNSEKGMMTISFNYNFDGNSKQFNLSRNIIDPLSSSFERIKLNISKLDKKSKGKPQKSQERHTDAVHVKLLIEGSTLDPKTSSNDNAWVDGAILELNGIPYQIVTNSPQVESIELPSTMMKGFIIMPMLNLINCDANGCQFTWYRRISASERDKIQDNDRSRIKFDDRHYWYRLSEELYYCPTDEDVAHYLKIVCSPSNGEKTGPESTCVSKSPVEIGPSNCPFEKRHQFTRTIITEPGAFRVVSYNILADLYADSDYSRTVLFGHCPTHALELEYRRQLLLKEISGYNADLICLQEVDRKEFLRTYEPFLKYLGNYSGIFNTKGGQVAEGQATFYRNDKYECIDSHRTLLSSLIQPLVVTHTENQDIEKIAETAKQNQSQCTKQEPVPHPFLNDIQSQETRKCLSNFDGIRIAILKNQELRKRFVDRHTILQTTLLKSKELDDTFIIVGNTHLYFAPDADHIRLLQGSVCVKYLEFIKEFYRNMLSNKGFVNAGLSVILCGDMNSTPDCGLYKLVTQGQVAEDLPDWTSNKEEAVVGLNVETHLRFSSAYKNIKYTNYTLEFNGCLDYIYYDRHALTCESVVPLPSHEDVTAVGGIPSDVFPSDHLALVANLKHSKQIDPHYFDILN